ncbi:MAG: hypothetical protein H6Q04_3197, partial [Acidobacteria bacterium]|nr:hypothetical protein [Acidobacteriota bacterium]
MEKMDAMDIHALICGDRVDMISPYVGGGHNG